MLPEDYQRNGNGQGGIEINLRETSEQDQLLLEEENRNLFEEYNNLIDQLR